MEGNIILVGGFPKPVGGITNFIRRLANTESRIEEVVDIYSDDEKDIPPGYSGRYMKLANKPYGFIYLLIKMVIWRNKYIHFNFSNLKSVLFFLLLPKYSTRWILMLHHGVLESRIPDFLIRYLLRKFDHILFINNAQEEAYCRYGVPCNKLIRASSYVKPAINAPDKEFKKIIDEYFALKPTFVASGFPKPYYNIDWCIRFASSREEYQLSLFLYGDGSERLRILELVDSVPNVRVFWDQCEDNFNYALSRSFYYVRPNLKDSFGIAVADAVTFGVPVLASDVCPRYQGAKTFRISTYEAFEKSILDSLNNEFSCTSSDPTPFVPFSYDLIS